MTQDEIISSRTDVLRMALEAGFEVNYYKSLESKEVVSFDPIITYNLERFAALVAANEKKFWMEQIEVECNEAVLAEREACAKLAENWDFNVQGLVKAIRARSEK